MRRARVRWETPDRVRGSGRPAGNGPFSLQDAGNLDTAQKAHARRPDTSRDRGTQTTEREPPHKKKGETTARHRHSATSRERLPALWDGCRTGVSRNDHQQQEAAPGPDQRERDGCRGIRGTRRRHGGKAACSRSSAITDQPQETPPAAGNVPFLS